MAVSVWLFVFSFLLWARSVLCAWDMVQFRDAMKSWASSDAVFDPNDALHTWRDPAADRLCDFEGVECYEYYETYWITDIDLEGLELTGSLPGWIWATARESINLSNNQWYSTTLFYEDTTSTGNEIDATQSLKTLNCSNCGFFLKAEEGTYVLPEEWSRYVSLYTFDISWNPNLIGQLPLTWETSWTTIDSVYIESTSVCAPFPFDKNGAVRVYGNFMSVEECPELPPYAPWEPTPPDPPPTPSYDAVMDEVPSLAPVAVDMMEGMSSVEAEIYGIPSGGEELEMIIPSESAELEEAVPAAEPSANLDVFLEEAVQQLEVPGETLIPMEFEPDEEDPSPNFSPMDLAVEEIPAETSLWSVILEDGLDDDLVAVPVEGPLSEEGATQWPTEDFDSPLQAISSQPLSEGRSPQEEWVLAMSPEPSAPAVDGSRFSVEPDEGLLSDFTPLPLPPEDSTASEEPVPDLEDGTVSAENPVEVIDVTEHPAEDTLAPDELLEYPLPTPLGSNETDQSQTASTLDALAVTEEPAENPAESVEERGDVLLLEEGECDALTDIGRLSAPLLTNSAHIQLFLHLSRLTDISLCERYLCEIHPSPSFIAEGPEQDLASQQLFWWIFAQEGTHDITLTVVDPETDCMWADAIHIRVDTTPPSCIPLTTEYLNHESYLAQLQCSELVALLNAEQIQISENGEITSVVTEEQFIRVMVRSTISQESSIRVLLPAQSYADLAGNQAVEDIFLDIPLAIDVALNSVVDAITDAPMGEILSGTMMLSSGLSTGAVLMGTSGSGGGFGVKTNIIRGGLHLQFLSLTAHLAVPNLHPSYIATARKFSWTTLAFRGTDAIESSNTVKESSDLRKQLRRLASADDEHVNTPTVTSGESSNPERDAFFDAFAGYSIFIGGCLLLRLLTEIIFRKWKTESKRPKILTFPRLDLQAVSITIPPVTFASTRLMMVGTPAALQLSLLALIVFVAPFTIWYVCCLTIRDLIIKPAISVEQITSAPHSPHTEIDEDFKKKGHENLFSTISGELIGVTVGKDDDIEEGSQILPLVLPHDEAMDDYVNEIERTLSTRVGSSPRTRLDDENTLPIHHPRTSMRQARIQPTTSEDEARCLLTSQRQSTASASGVDFEATDSDDCAPPTQGTAQGTAQGASFPISPPWRFVERHPPSQFTNRFGFVFEDIVGSDPSIGRHRLTPQFLLTHSLFFLHKVLAAAVFGFSTESQNAIPQISLLLFMHLLLLGHLFFIQPYIYPSLRATECLTTTLELCILTGATLLLFRPPCIRFVHSFMIFCFLSAVALLGLFELRHLCIIFGCLRRR